MKYLTYLVMILCIIFSFGAAYAEETDVSLNTIKEKGELVIGLCAQYPPFESVNDTSGQYEGFDIDLANALAEEMGVKAKIVDAQWQALLGGVEKGDYDVLITAMSKQEASAGNVGMSNPYYDLNEVIVVKAGDDSITSAADLAGKVVGVQSATGAEQQVDKLSDLKEIKRYDYNNDALIDLENGRVDAVVVGYATAVTEAKKRENLKVINVPVGEVSELVMVTSKDSVSLLNELNRALDAIQENGKYQKIVDTWLNLS